MVKTEVDIPNDWDGETYCCYSVMWPNSFGWLAILNGLIDTAGGGWFYNDQTGNVVDAANVIRATWSYNFTNEEVIMSCSDAIAEALQQIAASLQSSSGCCDNGGTSGGGFHSDPPSDVTTDEESREGPPPSGFSTWEEYDTYACNLANWIVDQAISDISAMSIWSATILSATVLAPLLIGTILTPIPGDELITLAVLFLQVIAIGVTTANITEALENGRDDIVCALLAGTDVNTSIGNVNEQVHSIMEEDPVIGAFGTTIAGIAASYVMSFFGVNSVNRMYNEVSYDVPEAECNCGDDCSVTLEIGTLSSGSLDAPGTVTINSALDGDRHTIQLLGDLTCWKISSCTNDGSSPQWWAEGTEAGCSGGDVPFYQLGVPDDGCYNRIHFYGDDTTFSSFQVTFTWECC